MISTFFYGDGRIERRETDGKSPYWLLTEYVEPSSREPFVPSDLPERIHSTFRRCVFGYCVDHETHAYKTWYVYIEDDAVRQRVLATAKVLEQIIWVIEWLTKKRDLRWLRRSKRPSRD